MYFVIHDKVFTPLRDLTPRITEAANYSSNFNDGIYVQKTSFKTLMFSNNANNFEIARKTR